MPEVTFSIWNWLFVIFCLALLVKQAIDWNKED